MQDGAEQAGNDIQNAINNMRNSLEEWYKNTPKTTKKAHLAKTVQKMQTIQTIQAVSKTIQAAKILYQLMAKTSAKTPTQPQPVQVVLAKILAKAVLMVRLIPTRLIMTHC